MIKILCTFPGRHGDLLWALPTVRLLAARAGGPVDLLIAGEFKGILPLLFEQPYLDMAYASEAWGMGHGWQPPVEAIPDIYEQVFHLGYRRWPERPLPEEPWLTAALQLNEPLPMLDLATPWITLKPAMPPQHRSLTYGFTDCHFELKYGITELLSDRWGPVGIFPPGSRWVSEGGYLASDWIAAAKDIASSKVFLTDCSALHVLAVAMGIPVVIVEPMEARWNPIFYPLGMDGPQVMIVRGLDGQPTWDARHVRETLDRILA